MPIRVLVADDHAVMRDGLRMILGAQPDIEVLGEAADGREAVRKAAEQSPDVVILDLAMPALNGIDAAVELAHSAPQSRVLVLTMHHSREHVARAIRAGARGYVLKESAASEVVVAVRAVAAGRLFFGRDVEPPALDGAPDGPFDALSRREREVLQLVVEGRTSAEIAVVLSLSPKSVETYRSRLMRKLGTPNLAALVRFALEHGLTSGS